MSEPLHIAVVAGEESGDLLGADLVRSLRDLHGGDVRISGLGGRHLEAEGLSSLFDPSEIALVGITAVIGRLPGLVKRISETARAIIKAEPDCLVIIDSPDFTHRVAKKVRAAAPHIPIVNYVCPSVWAWRQGRASAMTAYVDHVLAILPFEPEILKKLNGPPATYVGHRLVEDLAVRAASAKQRQRSAPQDGAEKTLLVLPGSRNHEVNGLLEPFREIVTILAARGHRLRIVIPTVSHVAGKVRAATADWELVPEISEDPQRKWEAFAEGDAALAASGTVLLELALVGVPMVSTYKTDPVLRFARFLIKTWSAALPNLIADRVFVPEYYDDTIVPGHIARRLERLICDTHARSEQLEGLSEIADRMATDRPSGQIAAQVVLNCLKPVSA